jgi:cysteine synthase
MSDVQTEARERIAANALELVGNTPLVRLDKIRPEGGAEIIAKFEVFNPGGSVKDRIALAMIEDAEAKGLLKPGGTIVEPTSGNTGVGLAMVAASKGYKLILTMPDDYSVERRKLVQRYGAQLILTPAIEGMTGAVFAAEELVAKNPGYYMPQQFDNPANPEVHRHTTAQEILRDTRGRLDAFVAGVGTGGTITGVGEVLKEQIPGVLVIAVEPTRSPVLAGGKAGLHGIQGIGASFVPGVLNREIYDELIAVKDDEAIDMAKQLTRSEGLLVGISSGANVFAAVSVARRLGPDKRVVTILPDTGERYLSVNF